MWNIYGHQKQHCCTHEIQAAERKAAPGRLNPGLVPGPMVHEEFLPLREPYSSVARQPKIPNGIPGTKEAKHGPSVLQGRKISTVTRPVSISRVNPFLEKKEFYTP